MVSYESCTKRKLSRRAPGENRQTIKRDCNTSGRTRIAQNAFGSYIRTVWCMERLKIDANSMRFRANQKWIKIDELHQTFLFFSIEHGTFSLNKEHNKNVYKYKHSHRESLFVSFSQNANSHMNYCDDCTIYTFFSSEKFFQISCPSFR